MLTLRYFMPIFSRFLLLLFDAYFLRCRFLRRRYFAAMCHGALLLLAATLRVCCLARVYASA